MCIHRPEEFHVEASQVFGYRADSCRRGGRAGSERGPGRIGQLHEGVRADQREGLDQPQDPVRPPEARCVLQRAQGQQDVEELRLRRERLAVAPLPAVLVRHLPRARGEVPLLHHLPVGGFGRPRRLRLQATNLVVGRRFPAAGVGVTAHPRGYTIFRRDYCSSAEPESRLFLFKIKLKFCGWG